MQVHVLNSKKEVGTACAVIFAAQLLRKPDSVLGLATGSSPIETYQQLIAFHKMGLIDFSRASSFNLDEYVGIDEANACSYHSFMKDQLFSHVNFKLSRVPDGNAKNLKAACRAYDKAIREAGGIDLQLLGIGRNGHIGFNEPADHFQYGTSIVSLTESTIDANRRFFASADDVPRKAISMGIGSIMEARHIVLIATGEDKAEAIKNTVTGKVDPKVPASILQMHRNATILLDKAAAALL